MTTNEDSLSAFKGKSSIKAPALGPHSRCLWQFGNSETGEAGLPSAILIVFLLFKAASLSLRARSNKSNIPFYGDVEGSPEARKKRWMFDYRNLLREGLDKVPMSQTLQYSPVDSVLVQRELFSNMDHQGVSDRPPIPIHRRIEDAKGRHAPKMSSTIF